MIITKVSLLVAMQLSSCSTFELHKFFQNAKPGEIFDFCHYRFYYSYPEFGMQWKNGKAMQFHQVYSCCRKCQAQPDRNCIGVGTLYLCMNENHKADFLCDDCSKDLPVYGAKPYYRQLAFF